MRNYSSIGMLLALLSTIPTSAVALGNTQTQPNNGFLDQEKPDWIEAMPIPPEVYPTLQQAIDAANLIKHENSTLQISSPTYERAHRLLLQNLLMMQRQLHFSPEALARFQSTSHPQKWTVDARIYEPNPSGLAVPRAIQQPLSSYSRSRTAVINRTYTVKLSRRTIVAMSEARALAHANTR